MRSMQNLKKKLNYTYPKLIREARSKKDEYTAKYWEGQIEQIKLQIGLREKNGKRNEKARKIGLAPKIKIRP